MSRLQERIENFNRAYGIFTDAVNAYNIDTKAVLMQMALIQSFEVCFELAWKILKDYLYTKAIEVYTPKDTIKSAFNAQIITNGQIWIDMANDRNASSHEYNMDKVSVILEKISTEYAQELADFQEKIKGFNE